MIVYQIHICLIDERVYSIGILVVSFSFNNNWKLNMKYITSFNGSVVVFVYQDILLRYMPKLSDQLEFIYACTCLMNVFRGILVVLFNFDRDGKFNMMHITSFDGSWVVFAYQVSFLRYMSKLG